MRLPFGLGFALIAAASSSQVAAATKPCLSVATLIARAPFDRYPAHLSKGPWRAPDVRRGDAHLYRTLLRTEGSGSPDFAGHLKLVRIGCGAGTMCLAFIDRTSGQVTFAPTLRSVSWLYVDLIPLGSPDLKRLTYRNDSTLLVVFGVRNEEDKTGGVTMCNWKNGAPHLVRFVPQRKLCIRPSAP